MIIKTKLWSTRKYWKCILKNKHNTMWSTEIIKWKQLYKIVFKDESTPNKLVTPSQFDTIKQKLFRNEWIEVDNELYNPFEIRKIIKFKTQDGIIQRLNKEPEDVQVKVREFMKLYKKELSMGVVENMILKAQGKDIS